MTVYQSNSNALVAYKVQSALGTQAGSSGASVLRVAGGPGIKLSKAATESQEVRADGMRSRGRHGTQKTSSSYNGELSFGSHDSIVEAIMRGTWDSSVLSVAPADMTSITISASGNTITAGSGNWITKGFRVHDVVRLAGSANSANNGKNLRIITLTSTVMTVAETLSTQGSDTGSWTLSRPGKRLVNPTSLVKRYFTLEENELDNDVSTLLSDFVWGSLKFQMTANGLVMADPGGIGTGNIQALSGSDAPFFSSPTVTTAEPYSVVDATIRVNGTDVVDLTGFELNMDIGATAPDVFGSNSIKYAPDVFTGQLGLSMNITALRKDLAYLSDFIAETQYSLTVLCVDHMTEPKSFFSIVVPNFTLGGVDPSALSNKGGGRTQTLSVPVALAGVADVATGYDSTMIKFQTAA